MRTKLAGTMWLVVTRSVSMSDRQCSASNGSMMTIRAPSDRCICAYMPGAVWYAGPHNRCTSSAVNPQKCTIGLGAATRAGAGAARSMPLGRPVVPDVYVIGTTAAPR